MENRIIVPDALFMSLGKGIGDARLSSVTVDYMVLPPENGGEDYSTSKFRDVAEVSTAIAEILTSNHCLSLCFCSALCCQSRK